MSAEKLRLTIATRNAHKTREFALLLGDAFEMSDLTTVKNAPLVEETDSTFAGNAILKAISATQVIPGMIVADDSGLEVEALGGAPGVYSARYAGPDANDGDNVAKLLSELEKIILSTTKAKARFRCVLALASGGKLLGTFAGSVAGRIERSARGASGFGYDPIFTPDGFTQTFGELDAKTKNQISHRAVAIRVMRSALKTGTMG